MSSFNSQHNSVPISVTPILPPLLLSSPHLFLPLGLTWTNTHQYTRMFFHPSLLFASFSTFFLHFSTGLPLLSVLLFFFFCRLHAFKGNSQRTRTVYTFILLCSVTWIGFSRDVSDHILSLWRFKPPRVSCFAL